jgi:hypothetical protein
VSNLWSNYHPRENPVKLRSRAQRPKGLGSIRRRLTLLSLFAFGPIVLFASVVWAEEQDVSGTWSASPLQVSWALGSWDEHCGPKPAPGGDRGGTIQLRASGSEFNLSGLGRSYSTTSCWEQLPGLQVRSHSASASTIRSTCEMPKGDPRQAKIVTTWALRGDKLYFDETGQYQFVSKEGACTASVRRTRLLSRVQTSAEDVAVDGTKALATPDTPSSSDPNRQPSSCTGQERAVRVDLHVATPLLRAGDALTVDSRAFAANGCRAWGPAKLEFIVGQELVEESSPGNFQVRLDAASGKLKVRVTVDDVSDEEEITVVSRQEIESAFAETLSNRDAVLPPAPEGPIGKGEGVAGPAGAPDRMPLLLAVSLGLLACAVALGALWMRRLSRKGKAEPQTEAAAAPNGSPLHEIVSPFAETAGVSSPHLVPARVCPTCGERYVGSETFCGKDGTRLFREN